VAGRDFSTIESIADFLWKNEKILSQCCYLINNYGPITVRPTIAVKGRDLLADFQQQVVPAVDISHFLIARAPLQMVLTIGFEYSGEIRAYQKILGYAWPRTPCCCSPAPGLPPIPTCASTCFPRPVWKMPQFYPSRRVPWLPNSWPTAFPHHEPSPLRFHYRYTNPLWVSRK